MKPSVLNFALKRRSAWGGIIVLVAVLFGVFLGMGISSAIATQTARSFESMSGMVLNYVSSSGVADFELVMARLSEALAKTEDTQRRQQAVGWRVYRAQETGPNGSVLFVSFIDPVVAGADYSVTQIISEMFPSEVQTLYETFMRAFAPGNGQIIVNLDLVQEFQLAQ